MAVKRVFTSTLSSCQYFFKGGKQAAFINHEYLTDIDSEIAELEELCKSGHPHIYINQEKKEVDTDAMSPLDEIKRKMREELLAEMKAATNPDNDRGNTILQSPQAGMVNSKIVADAMAGSDSAVAGIDVSGIKIGSKAGN